MNASHGTGSYDGSQQIGSSIGCGIKSKYSGAYIPDNGMKINKITVDTTGIVNATYIGGGVIPVPVNQNNA